MGELSPEMKKLLGHYEKGLKHYRAMEWDEGIKEFTLALEAVPDDGPSKLYLERCSEYKKDPPPPGWDGVYTAKTK